MNTIGVYGRIETYGAKLPRKASKDITKKPVPRTNTGGQEENSKVSEITMVKELGKITP